MNEPQELQITLRFKTQHSPDNPIHLAQVARHYLEQKGCGVLSDDNVLEI